jgi:hypothetical protein
MGVGKYVSPETTHEDAKTVSPGKLVVVINIIVPYPRLACSQDLVSKCSLSMASPPPIGQGLTKHSAPLDLDNLLAPSDAFDIESSSPLLRSGLDYLNQAVVIATCAIKQALNSK